MEFKDFELEIGSAEGELTYSIRADSPFMDPIEATFTMPFDELELEGVLRDVELAVLKGTGRSRRLVPEEVSHVEDFGEKMFAQIFAGAVGASYKDAVRRAREESMGLRIRLTTKAPELGSIPWEFLRDPDSGWVVLNANTPLVRHMRTTGGDERLHVQAPLRILGMISNPDGLPRLDVDKEKAHIAQALGELMEDGLVELGWTEGGTWRDLQNAIRHGPWHVLHYIGHGGFDDIKDVSVLAFEREGGGTYQPIEPEQLSRLVKADDDLRLVVLNACEGAKGDDQDALSSTAAFLVKNAAPAVLAMQWEISDKAALEFSRTFYTAVADGLAVDAALGDARVAMSMEVGSLEWATPVLFMRSEDGVLFDVSSPAAQPVVAEPAVVAAPESVAEPETVVAATAATAAASGLSPRTWKLAAGALGAAAVVAIAALAFGGNEGSGSNTTLTPIVAANTTLPGDTTPATTAVDQTATGQIVLPLIPRELEGHSPKAAVGVAFSPNGSLLASAGFDSSVHVWDVESGDQTPLITFPDHVDISVEDVVFLSNDVVASTGCAERASPEPGSVCLRSEVIVWSIESGGVIGRMEAEGLVGDLDASEDGSLLAGASRDGFAIIWDTESGDSLAQFDHPSRVDAVAFNSTATVLATAGDSSDVWLWNLDTGVTLQASFEGHPDSVTSVDFSPRDPLLASGGLDSDTFLWTQARGRQVRGPLEAPTSFVVAFGPFGEILATGDGDNRVRLWRVSNNELIGELVGHQGAAVTGIYGVAFSSDGKTMASTGGDGKVFIWVYRE